MAVFIKLQIVWEAKEKLGSESETLRDAALHTLSELRKDITVITRQQVSDTGTHC